MGHILLFIHTADMKVFLVVAVFVTLAAAKVSDLELLEKMLRMLEEPEQTELQAKVEVINGITTYKVGKRQVSAPATGISVTVPYDTSAGGEQVFQITSDPAGDGNCASFSVANADAPTRCKSAELLMMRK